MSEDVEQPRGPLHARLVVCAKTREDGDYYVDAADLTRHVKMWIEDGLSDRDDIVEVTVTKAPEGTAEIPADLTEPDDPAAHALAEYIASHSASTVMAACRYLGWKLTFDLQSEEACPECGNSGACAGGPCALLDARSLSVCTVCSDAVKWIAAPTGGWWAHWNHPADNHDAQPGSNGCPAGLLSSNANDRVEVCVVRGPHRVHRTALGEAWTSGEEV